MRPCPMARSAGARTACRCWSQRGEAPPERSPCPGGTSAGHRAAAIHSVPPRRCPGTDFNCRKTFSSSAWQFLFFPPTAAQDLPQVCHRGHCHRALPGPHHLLPYGRGVPLPCCHGCVPLASRLNPGPFAAVRGACGLPGRVRRDRRLSLPPARDAAGEEGKGSQIPSRGLILGE